jgi:hypothetical protein
MVERSGSILLGEVAGHLTTLEIACNRCERKGRAAMDRLMAQHGPAMSMPSLLSADCPKRQANKIHDVCGVLSAFAPTSTICSGGRETITRPSGC